MIKFFSGGLASLILALAAGSIHAQDNAELVSPAVYTQSGFNAAVPAREFANWQKRFQSDWEAMLKATDKSNKAEMLEHSSEYFMNSIESSKKGLSLKAHLIEAAFPGSKYVPELGMIAARMMLYPDAKPVGYGGTYEEGGYSVEIWYMVLHDMKKMTAEEFSGLPAYSIFEPLELPKFGERKRGSWPILLFIRDKQKRLMLYGHSKEMYEISDRVQWNLAAS